MIVVELREILGFPKKTKFLSPLLLQLSLEKRKFQAYKLLRKFLKKRIKYKKIFNSLSDDLDSLCFVVYGADCEDWDFQLENLIYEFHDKNPGFLSEFCRTLFLVKKGEEYFVISMFGFDFSFFFNNIDDNFFYSRKIHSRLVVPINNVGLEENKRRKGGVQKNFF